MLKASHTALSARSPRDLVRRFPLLLSTVLAIALCACGRAAAQTGPEPRVSEEARTHYQRGMQLYDAGDLRGALNEYSEALRLAPGFAEAQSKLAFTLYKAGLAERAEDWPWSSLRDRAGSLSGTTGAHPILPIDGTLLPADDRTRL